MKNVEYKMNTLKILNELSKISKDRIGDNYPIKILKDSEGIHVKSGNENRSIVFNLDAPSNNFDFNGDELCFYDYGEFFKNLANFDSPNLLQATINKGTDRETDAMIIAKDKSKINYPVSDSEVISNSVKGFDWPEIDTSFEFTTSNLQQIKNYLSLLRSKKVKVKVIFENSTVKFNIFDQHSSNSFETEIDLNTAIDEKFELIISEEVFKFLLTTNYNVEVIKDGYLRFFFTYEDVKGSILLTADDEEEN